MATSAPATPRVDSIAITEKQWQAMLAEPMLGAPYYGHDRRNGERVPYRRVGRLLIRMGFLGRRSARYLVRTRDVSAGGVSFFHSQSVPVGMPCELSLLTIADQIRTCTGQIAVCKECGDGVWQVGVQLRGTLDGDDFIRPRA